MLQRVHPVIVALYNESSVIYEIHLLHPSAH